MLEMASSSLADRTDLAARIDAVLPQTQCQRCGFADCASYAQAIAQGETSINRCPPGGDLGVARLAALTGQPIEPLDPDCGVEGPRKVAIIDEDWCIGCTLCIKACPTDAILGLNKRMHTVMAEHCTGCELCVPACPVDCIQMENASGQVSGWAAWSVQQANHARARYDQRRERLAREDEVSAAFTASSPAVGTLPANAEDASDAKLTAIAAVLARARAQRAAVALVGGTATQVGQTSGEKSR